MLSKPSGHFDKLSAGSEPRRRTPTEFFSNLLKSLRRFWVFKDFDRLRGRRYTNVLIYTNDIGRTFEGSKCIRAYYQNHSWNNMEPPSDFVPRAR